MEYTDKPHFVIKSMYLCRHLQQRGFKLQKTKINKFNPLYNVYLFDDTPQLRKVVAEYSRMKRAERTSQGR